MTCFRFPLSLQLIFPDLVEGLVLMNIDPNGKGWIDWAATKVSTKPTWPGWESSGLKTGLNPGFPPLLQLSGLTSTLPDTVLSHLFSQVRDGRDCIWSILESRGYRVGLSQRGQVLQAEPGWVTQYYV